MNFACSTCLESLSPKNDISTTPCGHVFHTSCIEKLFFNYNFECSKCGKAYSQKHIIKLYFSESESENDLILKLEEENKHIQEEANLSKSLEIEANEKCLKFQKENLKLQEEKLSLQEENSTLLSEKLMIQDENTKLHNVKLKIQEDNSKLLREKLMIHDENTKLYEEKLKMQEENLTLQEEKLRMTKHFDDLKTNSRIIENALTTKCKELAEEVMKAKEVIADMKSYKKNLKRPITYQDETGKKMKKSNSIDDAVTKPNLTNKNENQGGTQKIVRKSNNTEDAMNNYILLIGKSIF